LPYFLATKFCANPNNCAIRCFGTLSSIQEAMTNGGNGRGERLQIMLSANELTVLDDFRFKLRMPSRAAAQPRTAQARAVSGRF
jgi:hypothetical protein